MKTWMAALLAFCVTPALHAGVGGEITRSIIQQERKSIVAASTEFAQGQEEIFWPLYEAYRAEMGPVNERTSKLFDDYMAAYTVMTDAEAASLLDEWYAIEKKALAIRGKWIRKFSRRLPARVVARFFQIDNRLDVAIKAELATVVPLVR